MPQSPGGLPEPLSIRRLLNLVASLLVSLASGTNYVFSAYAPQLAARLHVSHTRLNVIALAGNVGVYLSSPVWGLVVDRFGPKPNMFTGFCFLLAGYTGIRVIYDTGLPSSTSALPTVIFLLLVMFSFMTGVGGNAGFSAALNATAKTFPDSMRGSTVGLVVSGFGLSAFVFSFIARHAFPGKTSYLLLTLALGTAVPMLVGFFIVRPIPLPAPGLFPERIDQRTPLLQSEDASLPIHQRNSASTSTRSRTSKFRRPLLEHIHGKELAVSLDFWILFSIFSLVSGTGLMYINNVGSMAQVLYIHENPTRYDDLEVSQWQATQVSVISLTSFVGRIFIGLLSDFAKAHFGLPRSHLLIVVTGTALCSQIVASQIILVAHLWRASALLGVAYGMLFSLCTSLVFEWFGLAHFSETVGFLTVSPLIGGNIFSLAFGRNLDAHETDSSPASPIVPSAFSHVRSQPRMTDTLHSPSQRQCDQGRACYVDTLYLTIGACALTVLLSIWAGWRDHKRIEASLIEPEADAEDNGRVEVNQTED
ncbi:hypothetical protein D9758_004666 [Tetrapyrgos nigripes]|uniref:Major facilitator superfamily (MFS) profile domain-containing protein n=1 Tax=Tetrapyrgos nigripes TaxID=182062 RepID=A0A8H5H049_9AGAR|nr:hypothetical protein D9758_004666 [Tetrapyrgos nigripes]